MVVAKLLFKGQLDFFLQELKKLLGGGAKHFQGKKTFKEVQLPLETSLRPLRSLELSTPCAELGHGFVSELRNPPFLFAAFSIGLFCPSGLIECYLASNGLREATVMANNVYKTLGANAQTLTLLATVCLEDPVAQEKAKTLLDKALMQRPDYIKAVVKKAELLSESASPSRTLNG